MAFQPYNSPYPNSPSTTTTPSPLPAYDWNMYLYIVPGIVVAVLFMVACLWFLRRSMYVCWLACGRESLRLYRRIRYGKANQFYETIQKTCRVCRRFVCICKPQDGPTIAEKSPKGKPASPQTTIPRDVPPSVPKKNVEKEKETGLNLSPDNSGSTNLVPDRPIIIIKTEDPSEVYASPRSYNSTQQPKDPAETSGEAAAAELIPPRGSATGSPDPKPSQDKLSQSGGSEVGASQSKGRQNNLSQIIEEPSQEGEDQGIAEASSEAGPRHQPPRSSTPAVGASSFQKDLSLSPILKDKSSLEAMMDVQQRLFFGSVAKDPKPAVRPDVIIEESSEDHGNGAPGAEQVLGDSTVPIQDALMAALTVTPNPNEVVYINQNEIEWERSLQRLRENLNAGTSSIPPAAVLKDLNRH